MNDILFHENAHLFLAFPSISIVTGAACSLFLPSDNVWRHAKARTLQGASLSFRLTRQTERRGASFVLLQMYNKSARWSFYYYYFFFFVKNESVALKTVYKILTWNYVTVTERGWGTRRSKGYKVAVFLSALVIEGQCKELRAVSRC